MYFPRHHSTFGELVWWSGRISVLMNYHPSWNSRQHSWCPYCKVHGWLLVGLLYLDHCLDIFFSMDALGKQDLFTQWHALKGKSLFKCSNQSPKVGQFWSVHKKKSYALSYVKRKKKESVLPYLKKSKTSSSLAFISMGLSIWFRVAKTEWEKGSK